VRDVLAELMSIWRADDTAGLGTVVRTFHSAPRSPGASMVVAPDGSVSGSVSGGCVEGAVYELATAVAQTGTPRLHRYGVSDSDALAVGLTCGGIIDIFVESVSRATFPDLDEVADDVGEHRAVAVATVIAHPDAQWVGRRLVIRPDAVTCRFPNQVSSDDPLNCGDASCLTRCHRAFVSNSCHFFKTHRKPRRQSGRSSGPASRRLRAIPSRDSRN
jgi:xanthine/CO dehydrogenase XdhC/CoxF family maturation factor